MSHPLLHPTTHCSVQSQKNSNTLAELACTDTEIELKKALKKNIKPFLIRKPTVEGYHNVVPLKGTN